jgi:protein SDA1
MGISSGSQPAPYGHQRDAVDNIDGLDVSVLSLTTSYIFTKPRQLLETYLEEEKAKQGSDVEMDEEKGWDDWDVESDDSSEKSSDSGWMNVDSDGDEGFDVSDSDEDKMEKAVTESAPLEEAGMTPDATTAGEVKRVSTLATTKVHISCIRCFYVDKLGKSDFNARGLCIATRTTTKGGATRGGSGCGLS